MSIFQEPRLESGFPDLVLVLWDRAKMLSWQHPRMKLTLDDLKVLHLLQRNPSMSEFALENTIARSPHLSLERLQQSDILVRADKKLRVRPLREIYAVHSIIALEAKINSNSSGLEQAILNTWFANESLLLLPKRVRGAAFNDLALQWNIRIMTPDAGEVIKPLRRQLPPMSYAAWQFNEWVWQANRDAPSEDLNVDCTALDTDMLS